MNSKKIELITIMTGSLAILAAIYFGFINASSVYAGKIVNYIFASAFLIYIIYNFIKSTEYEKIIKQLNGDISKLNERVNQLSADLEEKSALILKLNNDIDLKNKTIKKIENENKNLSEKVLKLEQTIEEFNQKIINSNRE